MRIGFDGRALASPAPGVRRYARELFAAMAALDPTVEIVAVGPPPRATLPAGVRAVPALALAPTNLGWTQLSLPLGARRARLDLFHAPAYTAPLWGVGPLVLTIHDVSYASRPEWYPYRRDRLRRLFYRRSALAADFVITVSEFSRREIVAAYGLDAARIAAVPLAPALVFNPLVTQASRAALDRPYVLHVGDLHPRRDVITALRAVLELRRRPSFASLALVLVGADRGSGRELVREAEKAGQPAALSVLGTVTDAHLAGLYASAAALVYPSRYEGFGLPLVEAMACGAPVIAARAGATPEVLGDAGIMVAPGDVRHFVDALAAVLENRELAGRMREASLQRAGAFSWPRTAQRTLAVYRSAIHKGPGAPPDPSAEH